MMNQKTEKFVDSEYNKALDFIYSFVDYERHSNWKYDINHFDLGRVRKFLHALNNPHEKGWFVHVTGTNGKGSVAAMIASTLTHSGYKTGLYTSPHLITFRERIKIDDSMISKGDIVDEVKRIKKAVKQNEGLTFFEVWTALAFDYFARKSVDVSVIEVGMGGRLDTTNVISPAVSVITSISMDHRGKLGETVEKIAYEKVGIIKPGITVVSAPQNDEVIPVLEKKVKESGMELILVGRDTKFFVERGDIIYSGLKWKLDKLHVPLAGSVQHENAAVALAALEILASKDYSITPENARRGIENVQWPGRFQTVSVNPEIIVDGACNINAMMAVRNYLREKTSKDKIVAVVGMCSDKDVIQVLEILRQAVSRFIYTQVDNPRALSARELANRSSEGENNIVEVDPIKALNKAISIAGSDGLVIVTGSLYLVGDVLKHYRMMENDEL